MEKIVQYKLSDLRVKFHALRTVRLCETREQKYPLELNNCYNNNNNSNKNAKYHVVNNLEIILSPYNFFC